MELTIKATPEEIEVLGNLTKYYPYINPPAPKQFSPCTTSQAIGVTEDGEVLTQYVVDMAASARLTSQKWLAARKAMNDNLP